jgi:hypothetical protein
MARLNAPRFKWDRSAPAGMELTYSSNLRESVNIVIHLFTIDEKIVKISRLTTSSNKYLAGFQCTRRFICLRNHPKLIIKHFVLRFLNDISCN